MLATVSLRKLGQDCVLSGPWLCRELSWISDLQGRVWAAAAPCGPARPRARVAGLSGLSLTLLDPVGGGCPSLFFRPSPVSLQALIRAAFGVAPAPSSLQSLWILLLPTSPPWLLPHEEPPQAALLFSLPGPWAGWAPQGSASSDLASSLPWCHQVVAGLVSSAGETGPRLGASLLHVVEQSGLSPRRPPGERDLDFRVVAQSSPKRRIQEGRSGKGGRPDLESAHCCHPTSGRTRWRA